MLSYFIYSSLHYSHTRFGINFKKNNNNSGVNIELLKTNRLKALCMMEIKNEINKLCVNKQRQSNQCFIILLSTIYEYYKCSFPHLVSRTTI